MLEDTYTPLSQERLEQIAGGNSGEWACSMAREVLALRKDAARLDWMGVDIMERKPYLGRTQPDKSRLVSVSNSYGRTLREAIDAAMEKRR